MTAEEIKELRRLLDMTQEEFARHCHVSNRTVVAWETLGDAKPTGPGAIKLREWLDEARARNGQSAPAKVHA